MPSSRPASAAGDRQRLNPLDIALRSVDQTIRGMGYPGFETQMLVWLSRRIDAAQLRQAISRLAIRHPAITARLVEPTGSGGGPYWQFQPDAAATLHELDVTADDEQSVLDCVARLLSQPRPPDVNPPLRFHLLHRPGGQDVLVLQYSHVLMDNGASHLVVQELDRLSQSAGDDDQPHYEPANLAARRLRSVPHAARTKATKAAFDLQAHTLRGRAAILGTGEEDKPRIVSLQILARTLDPELTRAIQAASARVCGFPSLSMSILASAFRAIRSLGPESRNADRTYIAGIGLELGLRRGQALLQNLSSIVPITARPAELADHSGLLRSLSRQMRDRLESRIDLGILRLAHAFQRRPRHIRWVTEHMLRWCYSLWYGYFGSLDNVQTLCGAAVERCYYIGPTWSPIGNSLLVNVCGGRLHLQTTFDPELIAPPLAGQLADAVVADLTEFAAG
ncbi:MAG: hypothetical protein L0211_12120 [Planctomycetaceae bacterium]|nr:hypothetical protein [Planctomycetaceae bacterium]